MEHKNTEHISEAVKLWTMAYSSLEAKNLIACLDCIIKFHNHMHKNDLLNDEEIKADIRAATKGFSDETFLYRVVSVPNYITRNSTFGAEIIEQVGVLKKHFDEFLEYCVQQKFDVDQSRPTIDMDKKIAGDIFLFCAKQLAQAKLTLFSRDPHIFLAKLNQCQNCDDVMNLYKEKFGSKISKTFLAIAKIADKAFIVEHADYSNTNKIVESDAFQSAIASEDAATLQDMRAKIAEEGLPSVLTTVHHSTDKKSDPRIQLFVCEVLRNNAFIITEKIQQLPPTLLAAMKDIIDARLQGLSRSLRGSITSIQKSHSNGHFSEFKSLTTAHIQLITIMDSKKVNNHEELQRNSK